MSNSSLVKMKNLSEQSQYRQNSTILAVSANDNHPDTKRKTYKFDKKSCEFVLSSDSLPKRIGFAQLNSNSVDALEESVLDKYYEQSKLKRTSVTREEFRRVVEAQVEVMFMESELARLGEAPTRKFVPYKDNIIELLLADDGWGPWNQAGLLSKPRLKEHDPHAYAALYNFERKNHLPQCLHIKTRSQVTDVLVEPLTNMQRRSGSSFTFR
jgi:hypothetical protein